MRVRTAAGPRELDADAGYVLPHEHVLCDVRTRWHGPGRGTEPDPPGRVVCAETIDEVRADPQGSIRENLVLSGEALAARELRAAADTGCHLVADLTVQGLGPRPRAVARAAASAGLHALLGIGRYTTPALTTVQREEPVGVLTDRWHQQVAEGVEGCQVGVLGELGLGVDFPATEQRTFRAAARVAVDTGLPVVVHTEIGTTRLHDALDVLEAGGVDPGRVTVGHLDWRIDIAAVSGLADRGYTASFDLFGRSSLRPAGSGSYADTDDQRIRAVVELVQRGYGDRLVLSHDICMRHCLSRYGGYGYAHLARTVFPRLHRVLGGDAVRQLTRVNPLRMLAFLPPPSM